VKNYWHYYLGSLVTSGVLGYSLYRNRPVDPLDSIIPSITPQVNAKTISDSIPPSKKFNFIANAVEAAEPAVVYIEVTDGRLSGFWGHHHTGPTSSGSGFFVNEDGLVLTNAHVVANAIDVTVKLKDGRQFKGVVVDIDQVKDLAAIRLNSPQVGS